MFWVDFDTSAVNKLFDLDKHKREIRKRGGTFEPGGASEGSGDVQTYDDETDVDRDTDYEKGWSYETASRHFCPSS